MYTRELWETIDHKEYSIWIYRDNYYGYTYEVVRGHKRWYGKKQYSNKAEAIKAGKSKVSALIRSGKGLK